MPKKDFIPLTGHGNLFVVVNLHRRKAFQVECSLAAHVDVEFVTGQDSLGVLSESVQIRDLKIVLLNRDGHF